MATWDMWYIDEGFLIWIIPLTYQSRESIIWACITSFVYTCIYRMFKLSAAYLYVPMLFILPSMHVFSFKFIDIHDLLSFLYVTCYCLYLHAWTTSLDHVHVWLLCMPLALLYVLAGLRLTTLNSHVQILETGPWWPCCSWSECAADPSVTIEVQQKLESSPQLFLPVPLLFGSRDPSCCSWAPLSFCISLRLMYFCIFWWCTIPVIL